jgi:hypothetical protein
MAINKSIKVSESYHSHSTVLIPSLDRHEIKCGIKALKKFLKNSSFRDLIFSPVCDILSVVSSSLAGLSCVWMSNPRMYAKVGIPHFSCCIGGYSQKCMNPCRQWVGYSVRC